MKLTVRSTLRPSQMVRPLNSDSAFWTFAATTWRELINPYVPYRDGQLSKDVTIFPKRIRYNASYAKRVYNSVNVPFRKDTHPLATAKWDIVARPIQGRKLVMSMQQYLKRKDLR